ncbi:MAG: amidase domain-containing protein [Clostridia bacterium]|nr:amidase domain-containing protein [Clostridia bacterium]
MSLIITDYNRTAATAYAKRWALSRNPDFYNFDKLGGDCTNFASQCVYAGSGVMNFTPTFGWYYLSLNDRTPSWTGVEYLYNFLTQNDGVGPFAEEVPLEQAELGDLVQLGRATGDFYHTPVITGFSGRNVLVSAHTYNVYNRPLSSYNYTRLRVLHILGVRKQN